MKAKNILVAMDDSEPSRRILPSVAEKAIGSDTSNVFLCHLLPPLPPELLESRGAEDPREEQAVERTQEIAQAKWIDERVKEGEHLVAESKKTLEKLGLPQKRIQTRVTEPIDAHEKMADAIIELARELGCDTIAVGHQSFAALREMLRSHIADQLQRRAEGIEIWVIQ